MNGGMGERERKSRGSVPTYVIKKRETRRSRTNSAQKMCFNNVSRSFNYSGLHCAPLPSGISYLFSLSSFTSVS